MVAGTAGHWFDEHRSRDYCGGEFCLDCQELGSMVYLGAE